LGRKKYKKWLRENVLSSSRVESPNMENPWKKKKCMKAKVDRITSKGIYVKVYKRKKKK